MALPGSPRLPYDQLPAHLRTAVDAALGSPVVGASPRTGGFSPGPAAVLTCADGSHAFVKALAQVPAVTAADPADVTDLLLVLVGMWAVTMRRPAPPGLPTLRAFQRRFHEVALAWVVERTASGLTDSSCWVLGPGLVSCEAGPLCASLRRGRATQHQH